jgi:hypothetical protein
MDLISDLLNSIFRVVRLSDISFFVSVQWSSGSVLATGPKVREFKPGRG